jgi:hypothetical protein
MNKDKKTILFYTSTARNFRTTLIGYLHQISQIYPVILLSEELGEREENILKNKEFFPFLKKNILVRQYSGSPKNIFNRNVHLVRIAKRIVRDYKPNIVIIASDADSFFEMYLARFAKQAKATVVSLQPGNSAKSIIGEKFIDLINSYIRFPNFFPLWLRLFFTKLRKYVGHFFYYYLLPLSAGEWPFLGKTSYILRKGKSGMRDSDFQIVFSQKDYDIFLEAGVPQEKLFIIPHPLSGSSRKIFEKLYLDKLKKDSKVIVFLLPSEMEMGFRDDNSKPILNNEREDKWLEIVKTASRIFPKWKIYIKPHPSSHNIKKLKDRFESINENIELASAGDLVEDYIGIADVVIGLPVSASSALFSAYLFSPSRPILSLDLFDEIMGDFYEGFNGIEYIKDGKEFLSILELIKANKYRKIFLKKKEKINFKNLTDFLHQLN